MADQFLNKTGLTRLWSKVKTYIDTKLPLTGGKLTGNLEIQPTGTPNLTLTAPEKENVGRSKTVLMKNASTTSDYGTQLIDYVWGDGTASSQRTMLRLLSTASTVKDRIALLDYVDGGSYTSYRLYGEHNKPSPADLGAAASGHNHDGQYLAISGGTLTGPITMQRPSGAPSINLLTQEKDGVGSAKTMLYKNANDSTDNGTTLADFVWGDGSANNKSVRLVLLAGTAYMSNLLRLRYDDGAGNSMIYRIYGEHYKPPLADVAGLETALAGKSDTGHTHGAGDIASGTLNTARLPTVPITKGGTGATDALAAITALGGLSAASVGAPLAAGDNIDGLTTPGTYVSPDATTSASLAGTPPTTGGGFKVYVVRSYTNATIFQFATGISSSGIQVRSKANANSDWTGWVTFATSTHTHGSIRNDGSIGEDTDIGASDRLVITDYSDGNLIKRSSIAFNGTTNTKALTQKGTWETFLQEHQDISGKADVGHTHAIADISGLQTALDGKSDTGHTHSYLPLAGGTLTGSLTIDPAGTTAPIFTLITANGTNGPGRMLLHKNANANSDNGTQLTDYVWGDGTSSNQRTTLRLRSSAAQLADRLTLIDYAAGGSFVSYRLYGEHYRPMVDGQTVMAGTEDLNTMTTIGWYICRSNALSRQVKHTPNFDTTTLVNSSMVSFNMTIGRIGSNYIYQELLLFNTGKRWYRYTANPTAASPSWGAWNEH